MFSIVHDPLLMTSYPGIQVLRGAQYIVQLVLQPVLNDVCSLIWIRRI